MTTLRKLLLGNCSLATLFSQLKPITAKQLANVLSQSYMALGLHHLDKLVRK